MSTEEIKSWFKERDGQLFLLYSNNFVDYNAKDDYIKRAAMLSFIDSFTTN